MTINLSSLEKQGLIPPSSGVRVHKYILEVHTYPNGRVYLRPPYPIGETMKQFKQKKPKTVLKKMEVKRDTGKEEVTLL